MRSDNPSSPASITSPNGCTEKSPIGSRTRHPNKPMVPVAPAPSLVARAARLEETVEHHLVESHGLVLSWVDSETMRPFARGFFTPDKDVLRHPGADTSDFGAYIAYENTGMCTGAYLAAMVWKHRATGETTALEHARRTFGAISHLYDLSQQIEPGYFSKFHYGRLSREISTDQCLYAMIGLDQFATLATDPEKEKIRKSIGGITGMWMRRGYRHPYRERTHDWQWPLNRFPVFCWLAWKHTGEARFRDEFERLAALPEMKSGPPFVPALPDTKEPFGWPAVPEHTASAAGSLVPLLEQEAPARDTWLQQLRVAYKAGRMALGDDWLERGHFSYDPVTGQTHTVEKPYYAGGKPNPIWRNKGFLCDVKSGHSPTMFARQIHRYHADLDAAETGRHILEAIDLPQMRWKIDYRNHLPPDQQWLTRAFDGDALVHWLWAYWLAQAQGQITR
jgi:hypothetical protein